MAILANGPAEMAAWVNSVLVQNAVGKQMLIIPLAGVDSPEQQKDFLSRLTGYRQESIDHDFAVNSSGLVELNAVRTVDDAIAELTGPLIGIGALRALLDCAVSEFIEGKVVAVATAIGELLIDREAYAKALGLPLVSADKEIFTAFVLSAGNSDQGERNFFVLVAGPAPRVPVTVSASLDGFFPLLEARAESIFEVPANFRITGMKDGWALFSHERFGELVALLRGGYVHAVVEHDGALVISY